MTRNSNHVGPFIRQTRKERDLSQKALAEAAGLSLSALGKLERGQQAADDETIVRLCIALNMDVKDFFAKVHGVQLDAASSLVEPLRRELGVDTAASPPDRQLDYLSDAMDLIYAEVKKVILNEVRKLKDEELALSRPEPSGRRG